MSRARLRHVIDSLDLGNIVPLLRSCYKWRLGGPGRPPHSPQGMLFSFAVMLAKGFTYRDMEDFLAKSDYWKRYLGFREAPDHSCYTDFLARVGPRFEPIFRDLVLQLAKRGVLRVRTAVPDSFPLEAHRADWGANHGFSTRLGLFWGYKTHAVASGRSELPMAFHFTPASVHDSVPFPKLLGQVLGLDIERVVADSAFDSAEHRASCANVGIKPVIQKNPRRNPGPGRPENKRGPKYKRRTAVERMFARLLDWFHLRQMRWRGTERVASVVLVAFIGMNVFAFLGKRMGMSPRAARSILRAL
ncbi:MAG: transposase [Halobacteria archaeon]